MAVVSRPASLASELVPAGVTTTAGALIRVGTACLTTGWGPLDVFVDTPPPAEAVVFDGVLLWVKVAA